MFMVSIGVNRCVRIQRTIFLDFLIACQRGWWCTMDTPIPHLENWLKKLRKKKKVSEAQTVVTYKNILWGGPFFYTSPIQLKSQNVLY